MRAFCPRLLLALSFACLAAKTTAYVVGGAVMHHGALALDPRNFNSSLPNATDAATALHYAALHAGLFIQGLEPEILVLITPHGLALTQPYLLYSNPSAEGSVDVDTWLPCSLPPCVYNASARIDVPLSKQLETSLAGHKLNVMTLSGFGAPGDGTLPLPLAWGEVIPLYFIGRAYSEPERTDHPLSAYPILSESYLRRRIAGRKHHQSLSTRTSSGRIAGNGDRATTAATTAGSLPRLVILSLPSRRYNHSVDMVPELLALGAGLFAELDSLNERIAVVVSGDLAHTWDPEGPYGFSVHAERFDTAVLQWARNLDRDALLKTAAKNVLEAKSCGFPGMVILQGLMDHVKPDNMHSVLLEYGHPSYYGMMCAVFDFQGDA
ncbi:hypothetical protein VaNZ11_012851 [Volvox africanus]|uniref:Extradiol ring-cleavage dioxygenase class III enzyme subunit B domain-containing protein n=1 Tax=Volvox africanus TaxID=51714 RepID=A0ABQ5SFY9_9CHLO|nr:hypothetical protein VaNZ11_012851 [Volvox africanus]